MVSAFIGLCDVRDVFAQCHPFSLAEWSPACQTLVSIGIMSHTHQLGSFSGYLTLGKSLEFSGLHLLSCELEVLRSLTHEKALGMGSGTQYMFVGILIVSPIKTSMF